MMKQDHPSEYERKRIEGLFLRFAAAYGYLWQNLFMTELALSQWKTEWTRALRPFETPVIKIAVERCLKQLTRPPTLPEFLGLCKDAKNKNSHFYKPEKVTPANPAVAKHHLQTMKALLNSTLRREKSPC